MSSLVSERKRVREVRKYYVRSPDDVPIAGESPKVKVAISESVEIGSRDGVETSTGMTTSAISSPNKILTALCQLIAVRLGMERAMISVVDANAQYFLAESTKTLDLVDPLQHEKGDELWMGCSGTVRREALCSNTIKLPSQKEGYSCFSVSDLSQDPKFNWLPYVAGSPHFKFYAGTPLLTRDNIPIGSVFVIDRRPRGPPTKFEVNLLGLMAKNVMEYLEGRRESQVRARIEVMNLGLAALVDGKHSIFPVSKSRHSNDKTSLAREHQTTAETETAIHSKSPTKDSPLDIALSKLTTASDTPLNLNDLDDISDLEEPFVRSSFNLKPQDIPTHEQLFPSAANLLRECLDINYVVFMDNSDDFKITTTENENACGDKNSDDEDAAFIFTPGRDEMDVPANNIGNTTSELKQTNSKSSLSNCHYKLPVRQQKPPANVLALSTGVPSSTIENDGYDSGYVIRPPQCKYLRRLIKKYPEGKLWALDDEVLDDSSEGDYFNNSSGKTSSKARKLNETKLLAEAFPGAKQILFAPLWDVEKAVHIAACFAVFLEPTPIFTMELEGAFVRAFMNNVSIACSRASMAAANRQKGDFISSISHELRSPLHGILASVGKYLNVRLCICFADKMVELLTSSLLDRRQKEYCSTISTCGQSLLETITGILEHTKINTLRNLARKTPMNDVQNGLTGLDNLSNVERSVQGLANGLVTSSNVDIGKVCEDSVRLVAAAYMHHAAIPDQPLYRVFVPPEAGIKMNGDRTPAPAPVTVILDIAFGNWKLMTLPGAMQRIVMNLVGNSLKYTNQGFVQVTLSLHPSLQDETSETITDPNAIMVELNVSDSGRGISSEFLKTKLFSAFSQETTLAPGTGLGLHLVKSLVQMHHGFIDIQSEVGKGTRVTVKLPLRKAMTGGDSLESGQLSSHNEADDTVISIINSEERKVFHLFGLANSNFELLRESLRRYLVDWFHMKESPDGSEANIFIVDEDSLTTCLRVVAHFRRKPTLIVVCDQTREELLNKSYSQSPITIELLTIPFGPYKLSKAIKACLEPVLSPAPVAAEGFKVNSPQKSVLSPPVIVESPCQHSGDSFPWTSCQLPPSPPDSNGMVSNPHPRHPITAPTRPPLVSMPRLQPHHKLKVLNASPEASDFVESETSESAHHPKILCVDDNSINLRLLKTFMEKLKFQNVTCAENGSVAFEAVRCQKDRFDLIFMDLSMPVCDGFQCISLIRTLEKINLQIAPPNLPPPKPALIVALTGLASQRDQDAAKEAGADHFLTKPLRLSKLTSLLGEWGIINSS